MSRARKISGIRRSWQFLLCAGLLAGCDIINPADPVPAYLYIGNIAIEPVAGTGTNMHKVTEAWVFVDGNPLGAYDFPATVPVIGEGLATVIVRAGIRVNGVLAAADTYPFFMTWQSEINLAPLQTLDLPVQSRYLPNVVFALIEDFESAHGFTDLRGGDPAIAMTRTTGEVFEGSASGSIVLNTEMNLIQVANLPLLSSVPVNGSPVYLELHYKNNVNFSVGLVGHDPGISPAAVSILVLRPQEEWNKVYIDLTPAVRASQYAAYQILFSAVHDPVLEQSEVYLDNIKLLHFVQ